MPIRSASDAFATIVAWFPILVLIVAVGWALTVSVLHLEMNSLGSEMLISNAATDNRVSGLGGSSSSEILLSALESGDVEQMEAALARVEATNHAISAPSPVS